MELRFYHFIKNDLRKNIALLLEKILQKDYKVFFLVANDIEIEEYDRYLWTFHPDKFLAHGISNGEFDDKQPILIGSKLNNKKNRQVCICNHEIIMDNNFEVSIFAFDDMESEKKDKAKIQYQEFLKTNIKAQYIKQQI